MMASSAASSPNASVMYRGNWTDGVCYRFDETLVRPPEYTDKGVIENMDANGTHIGFDGSIMCEGDIVFCAQGEEKGIYTIDYWFGSNTLKFHTGALSIVPICQTAWKRSDCETEYLLAHNLILLSGGESHPNRMGPVASCIARLCRKWKQQRTEAKRTREGELEAKRCRREQGDYLQFEADNLIWVQAQLAAISTRLQRFVQADSSKLKIKTRTMDEAIRAMNEATQAMNEATRAMNEAAQGLCGAPFLSRRLRISAAQTVISVAPE